MSGAAASEPEPYREKFKAREVYTKVADPCEAAAKASMDCLDKNDYKRSQCLHLFEAYRECKKTWISQRRADRRAGKDASLT
ncbi:hypothetical protein BJ322DRAFT_775668 [Thelephora terrestris]|uniref:CHCH domain-containing protein n=1 Tax=Thelephora terrestris TaxID=56493 RepID=A0A9P6HIS6_9AGAM|nr:hypothetical protein BJ322DRAFT_775668 [Thelephora terrestris]